MLQTCVQQFRQKDQPKTKSAIKRFTGTLGNFASL